VLFVPGNHDVTVQSDALAQALVHRDAPHLRLASITGDRIAGMRVAGLSVLRGTTWFDANSDLVPSPASWGDSPVVWLSHFPILSLAMVAERAGLRYPGDLGNLDAVAAPLVGRTVPTVVLHGHAHLRVVRAARSLLQIGCAALIEPPFEITLVDIVATAAAIKVDITCQSVASTEDFALPVLAPAHSTWMFTNGRWIAAPAL
jgi:hypothetical protein